mgnify:FL=1
MKSRFFIAAALMAALFTGCKCSDNTLKGDNWHVEDGVIVTDEPKRAAGQESMLAFRADPIPVVRVGFVGLGMRGPGAVSRFTHLEGVEIKALCDKYPERAHAQQRILTNAGLPEATEYSGDEAFKCGHAA